MTASRTPGAEPVLEAYVEATRIVASAQLVRRFEEGVAVERARDARRPWSGSIAWARGARSRLVEPMGTAFAPQVTFAIRLQGLALLLLLVVALGAAVGGAGTVLVSVVAGPDRGSSVPVSFVGPSGPSTSPASLLQAVPAGVPSPVPVASTHPLVTTRSLPQQAPRPRHHRGGAHRRVSHPPACLARGGWSRSHRCAW